MIITYKWSIMITRNECGSHWNHKAQVKNDAFQKLVDQESQRHSLLTLNWKANGWMGWPLIYLLGFCGQLISLVAVFWLVVHEHNPHLLPKWWNKMPMEIPTAIYLKEEQREREENPSRGCQGLWWRMLCWSCTIPLSTCTSAKYK